MVLSSCQCCPSLDLTTSQRIWADGNWIFGKQLSDAVSCIVDTDNQTVEIRILKSALTSDERKLVDIVFFGFRFITGGDDAIASSNGGKFLTYKMMTK